jgi:hypothetical protein
MSWLAVDHSRPLSAKVKNEGMPQAVTYCAVTARAQVQTPTSSRELCSGQTSTGTGFSPSTWVCPSEYNSTIPSHSCIHP